MMRKYIMSLIILLPGCHKPAATIDAAGVPCSYIPDTSINTKYRGIAAHQVQYDCGEGEKATAFFSRSEHRLFAIVSTDVQVFSAYLDHSTGCRFLGIVPSDYRISIAAGEASMYSCLGGTRTLRLESTESSLFVEEFWPERIR